MSEPRGHPRSRRPGRPRTVTVEKVRRRLEFEEDLAKQELVIEDHDHGEVKLPVHLLSKGKVIERLVSCGRKGCPCTYGGRLHGPYYYLVVNIPPDMRKPGQPRQKWIYLTKEEAERFRRRIRNMHNMMDNMFSDLLQEFHIG